MSSLDSKVNEIKLDVEDLNKLLENASRKKSKDVLSIEIKKLQAELINLQKQIASGHEKNLKSPVSNNGSQCYDTKLNNYAWDQSDKFIKLYVTLNNVHTLPKESVFCNFHNRSIDLHVVGLNNRNYVLPINNLCEDIDTEKSYIKVRSDMVVIFLHKKAEKFWQCVTSVEKILKEAKESHASKFEADDANDPNASLMSMMKKMYQQGDDEMKKTIAKAWTQSQDRKQGLTPDLPEL